MDVGRTTDIAVVGTGLAGYAAALALAARGMSCHLVGSGAKAEDTRTTSAWGKPFDRELRLSRS